MCVVEGVRGMAWVVQEAEEWEEGTAVEGKQTQEVAVEAVRS